MWAYESYTVREETPKGPQGRNGRRGPPIQDPDD